MVIAATVGPPMVVVAGLRRAAPTEPATPAPPSEASRARRFGVSEGGRLPLGAYQRGGFVPPGATLRVWPLMLHDATSRARPRALHPQLPARACSSASA